MKILGVPKIDEPAAPPSLYVMVRVYLAGEQAGTVEALPDGSFDSAAAGNVACVALNKAGGHGPTSVVALMHRREYEDLADLPADKEGADAEAVAEARRR